MWVLNMVHRGTGRLCDGDKAGLITARIGWHVNVIRACLFCASPQESLLSCCVLTVHCFDW